jgi:tRNA threonylcarbamoyladenosine biosynthesis protein TsaB
VNILAIETSTRSASLAVVRDHQLIEAATIPQGRQTASWLNEAVDAALRNAGVRPDEVGLVGITSGPGSFTGLRIAVTFAKLFCYSTSAALVALDALDVIANQAVEQPDSHLSTNRPLHAVMDAMRGELFHASFDVNASSDMHPSSDAVGDLCQKRSPTVIKPRAAFLAELTSPVAVVGPGVSLIRDDLPEFVWVPDDRPKTPTAATVARLAWEAYGRGQRDDIWSLVPQYHRKSYAEKPS